MEPLPEQWRIQQLTTELVRAVLDTLSTYLAGDGRAWLCLTVPPNSLPHACSTRPLLCSQGVRLRCVHTAEEDKWERCSRDDVRLVVRCQEAWPGDQVAQEEEETSVVGDQQERA